jgi:hypothetical protein
MTKLDRNIVADQIPGNSRKPAALFEAELESAISSRFGAVFADSPRDILRRPKSDKGV